jgi:iron complex outermembrane receptor protein
MFQKIKITRVALYKRVTTICRRTTFFIITILLFFTAQAQTSKPDSVRHLEGITIEYTPPTIRTSANITTMSIKQIQKQQGNGSINNLLEWIPSMVTTSDAGTGIGYTYMRIRGIDQTRINVTLNGVTINDAESQGSWLVNLPDLGSYLEEVQVQSGANTAPGAISYGARIDFITREIPAKPFAEVKSAYGSFNTFHNTISAGTGLLNNRFSALAAFSDIRSDGFIDRAHSKLNSAFLTAQYKLLNKLETKEFGTLRFNLLWGTEHTGLAWNGVPFDSLSTNRTYNSCGEYWTDSGERRYYADETDNYTQTRYQLEYEKRWGKEESSQKHQLNIAGHLTRGIGYYQEYKDDKEPSEYGLFPIAEEIETCDFVTQKYLDNYYYGVHANYKGAHRLKGEKFHEISWQGGADFDNYYGEHYGNVIWAQPNHVSDFPVDYQWYNGLGKKFQSKLFVSFRYLYDKFSLRTELQYRFLDYRISGTDDNLIDVTQDYLWNFVNPKISLHYYLSQKKLKHSFALSFSTANREPTRSDIIEAPAHKKPIPETLYDLEFSYMMHHDRFYVNATLYGMYYKNQLVLTGEINDVGAAIMANVENSYRMGAELAVAYNPVKFFTWRINGNFSRNRILNYVNFVDNWDDGSQEEEFLGNTPISFSPNVVLANDFTFTPIKRLELSLITKFVSRQYLDNSGNETYCLKPYTYTNLRISYTFLFARFAQELELFVQANNLFNAKYESNGWIYSYYYGNSRFADAAFYPQAGINFLGGIRLRF